MKGLYIHIPFCLKKCNYCDFCSYVNKLTLADDYIECIINEAAIYRGEIVDTVYLGGGTPSVLKSETLKRLMTGLNEIINIEKKAEITIEVNPCTVTEKKAKLMKEIGINRVSMGAQSFVDSELKSIGRLHTSEQTEIAFKILRKAGFKNISLDLMYALPGQTMDSLSTSIDRVLKLSPEHISCYGLKIEDNTLFSDMKNRGEIAEKTDDEYADMYEIICSEVEKQGYIQYELSNFSKPDFESKHNIKYWTASEYIGLGVSAASFCEKKRYTNTSNIEKYMQGSERSDKIALSEFDLMSEFIFLSLRLTNRGASRDEFKKRFGREVDEVFEKAINKHKKNGLLIDLGDRLVLAKKAYFISNSVLCDFV